jgi:tetratricopeptide (TPR) repeat protein
MLADLYLKAGRSADAQEQMRQIIALQPQEWQPRLQFAIYLAHEHKFDDAQRVLQDAVKDLPKNTDAKLALVDFIATQRSQVKAQDELRGFIAAEPDNSALRFGLATLQQRAGAADQAVVTYKEIMRRDGTGADGLSARDRVAAVDVSAGHLDEAQQLIAEVLERNSRDHDALVLRADISLQRHRPADAIVDLREVLREQPKSTPILRMLARAYVAKSEPALAEETLRSALDSSPDDTGVKIELAQLLAQTERAAQAATLLEQTVNHGPDSPAARGELVKAYMAAANLPAARGAAEDLKTRYPQSPAGFFLAGMIAQQQGRLDDSERDLERALALRPGAVDVLAALAQTDFSRGAPASAIARVRAVVDHDPKNAQTLNLLGDLYFRDHDPEIAGELFARAAAVAPRWWLPYRNLALVKIATNDLDGAAVAYDAALKIVPDEPQLGVEMASLDEKRGRIDAAIARYGALLKTNSPLQQLAANNLAMLLVTYRTDRASLDRARDLTSQFTASQNGTLLDTQGWVSFKRGEYRDAVPQLEQALEHSPDSRVIRYHLGMAQLQLGQRDRARSNLEAALAGAGSFSGADEARIALASLKASSG